jgi:hypothetical protein
MLRKTLNGGFIASTVVYRIYYPVFKNTVSMQRLFKLKYLK